MNVKIVECPRDAMQGIKAFIPTETKVSYIQSLLDVGFDTIDFGSFVSPKAIPQMRDTAEVLNALDLTDRTSKLLAIVANARGANDAGAFEEIDVLGYPFSISEEFQRRNTNAGIEDSLGRVEEIKEICEAKGKALVLYLSMAFGNPYGETWHPDIAIQWSERLHSLFEVKTLALSDTIGVSNETLITSLFESVNEALPHIEFGAHLHTTPETWEEKIKAAWNAGCRRFDGAINGYGGCPMAKDDLTGNMPTENMVGWFEEQGIQHGLDLKAFEASKQHASSVFL